MSLHSSWENGSLPSIKDKLGGSDSIMEISPNAWELTVGP